MAPILRVTEFWFTLVSVVPGMREGGFIFIMFCKSTGQHKRKELLGRGGGINTGRILAVLILANYRVQVGNMANGA